jgi:hypothetical protein
MPAGQGYFYSSTAETTNQQQTCTASTQHEHSLNTASKLYNLLIQVQMESSIPALLT